MSYKKYIKRNGKLYGPYEFESKRVDGKVVTEYHGAKKTNFWRNFVFIIGALFVIFGIIWIIGNIKSNSSAILGHSVLELNADYKPGEILNGKLDISLNNGELLPADSKIIIENSGKIYEFPLKEVVSEEINEGKFYVNGKDILGTGQGYGREGNADIYPQVYFKLNVYSEEENQESEQTTETPEEIINESAQEETPTETSAEETTVSVEETPTETPAEETNGAPITGNSIGRFISGGSITGKATLSLEKQIDGVVNGDKEYTYELNSGESIELQPLSVRTSSENLEDSYISIKTEGNKVIITTDYSEKQKGFGEEFIEDNTYKISVDLNKLNLNLDKGELGIKVVYNQEEILSLNAILDEDVVVDEDNQTISDNEELNASEENLNESINISQEDMNQTINATINQTQENLSESEENNLTIQEKAALLSAFGNTPVSVVKSELFKGRKIIGYKLGNYEIEYSYDSSLSEQVLDREMEKDRVKWLKDIANSLVERESEGENITGINVSYEF